MGKSQEDKLKRDLIADEGKRSFSYICPGGKTTIGVGRNLEDKGLSGDEIEYLLSNDISDSLKEVQKALPFFAELNDVRQNVLVNMAFNLGITGLMRFKKALRAMAERDFPLAAAEMLDSRWAIQVKSRATRLAEEMRTGKWS